jgi:rhodanese-related sulfurtransferase
MDPHFDGVIFQTHAAELQRRLRTSYPLYQLLDVRPTADFDRGHIAGAVSVSVDELASALPAGCQSGTELFVIGAEPGDPAIRAASLALLAHGCHRIVELPGGILEWQDDGGALAASSDRAA